MGTRRSHDRGAIAVPWRPSPDRMQAFEFVRRWWSHWGYDIITADSNPDLPFSLSEARNNAVRAVEQSEMGPGVVILCDADTVPDRIVISKACDIAVERGHVVYPFNEYRYLDVGYTKICDEGATDDPQVWLAHLTPTWSKANSVGGVLVTHTDTYWEVGGMDERFERTWGFEDNAFVAAADTLVKVIRLPGNVYSFSHEVEGTGRDWTELNPNFWRNQLYQHCYGNQKLMRELIKR